MPAPARNSRLTANLIGMASMLIWATGFPAVDRLLPVYGPLPLTALRMGSAILLLLPLWLLADGAQVLARAPWRRGLWIGAAGFGVGAFLIVLAQQMTDAVTVAIISSTMPVIGIALECLFDGRRLTLLLLLGLALGILGGTLAYLSGIGSMGLGLGALVAFGSTLTFTWASRETVRGLPQLSSIGRTAITFTGGALATTICALVAGALGQSTVHWAAIDLNNVAMLAYYGIASLAISQILWIVAVGRLGIGIAAMHINAAPFYTMIIVWLLGAAFNWAQAAGAALVLLGVLVAQRPAR